VEFYIFHQFIPNRNGKRETNGKKSVESEAKMIRKAKSAIYFSLGFSNSNLQQISFNFLKGHEKTRGLLKIKAISNKKHKLAQKNEEMIIQTQFPRKIFTFQD
jgi:hypothetical protein